MKAADLLEPGDSALVVFSRGTRFRPEKEFTGDWPVVPARVHHMVIVYHRPDGARSGGDVWRGLVQDVKFVRLSGQKRKSRLHRVFAEFTRIGHTDLNWPKFAPGCGRSRGYIEKRP